MHRFFCPDIPTPDSTVTLSAEESAHLHRVLRLTTGERVELTDGRGTLAVATIQTSDAKRSSVIVEKCERRAATSRVHVCFGIPKSQACDFIVHRCTEAGVAAFHPLLTRHSLHPASWNAARWEKVIAEVGKQCQEIHFPLMHEPLSLEKWLTKFSSSGTLLLCDENARSEARPKAAGDVYLLVGAEGGWAPEEISQIRATGASLLSLGQNRLRAETATLAATILAKHTLQEI